MGRRYKRNPSNLTALYLAPWWLSVVLAVVVWIVGRTISGHFAGIRPLHGLVPLVETLTIIVVVVLVLIAALSFVTRKLRTVIGLSLNAAKFVDEFRKGKSGAIRQAGNFIEKVSDTPAERREPIISSFLRDTPSYKVREGGLLTQSEITFYRALERAVGHQFRILSMVRVGDALFPNQAQYSKGWAIALSRVNQKHFDFVLCDWESFELVAAIELDDPTHFKKSRKKRDAFLNKTCEEAGLPLVRFWVGDKNTPESICETINQEIGSTLKPRPVDLVKYCSRCDAPMLRYRGTSGALAGKRFWRCARYPACRGIVPILETAPIGQVDDVVNPETV